MFTNSREITVKRYIRYIRYTYFRVPLKGQKSDLRTAIYIITLYI